MFSGDKEKRHCIQLCVQHETCYVLYVLFPTADLIYRTGNSIPKVTNMYGSYCCKEVVQVLEESF
jgi:hypothetical protein